MSRILTLFDESALGDDDIITQIISHLLKYQTVADMVLQVKHSIIHDPGAEYRLLPLYTNKGYMKPCWVLLLLHLSPIL